MIISEIKLLKQEGTIRAEAKIVWENKNISPYNFFIQTEEEYEDVFWADPNAFLIALAFPAWGAGEERILVQDQLCPVLSKNMKGAFRLLKTWFPNDFGPAPLIEASNGFQALRPFKTGAISLLSAGIDSLSILRSNKLLLPPGHLNSIQATVSVSQQEAPARNLEEFNEQTQGRLKAINAVAEDLGVLSIRVTTNSWWLNPDGNFFSFKSHGAQFLSALAFFSKGFHKGYIASSFDSAFLHKPWGSHPQLDSYFSSSHFQTEHTGTEMTRIEKVALVADWPVGLQNIRVCQNDSKGRWNCGTCEKCIRTMVVLESLGKLRESESFPENEVSIDLLNYLETYNMLFDPEQIYLYSLAIPLLEKRGRTDLVEALEKIIGGFNKKQKELKSIYM